MQSRRTYGPVIGDGAVLRRGAERRAAMGVHDGHRKRRREQFIRHGLDAFADHEVLELLLFYAIGRRDTNPIAHALLDLSLIHI